MPRKNRKLDKPSIRRQQDAAIAADKRIQRQLNRELAKMERGPFTGDSADPDAEEDEEEETDPETGT